MMRALALLAAAATPWMVGETRFSTSSRPEFHVIVAKPLLDGGWMRIECEKGELHLRPLAAHGERVTALDFQCDEAPHAYPHAPMPSGEQNFCFTTFPERCVRPDGGAL